MNAGRLPNLRALAGSLASVIAETKLAASG